MQLRIVRPGHAPLELTLVRRPIALPYVSSRLVALRAALRVCVIRLLSFPATRAAQGARDRGSAPVAGTSP